MQDNDLRQSAVYGLGVAAQHRRDAFRPVAAQAGPAAPCITLWLCHARKSSLYTHHGLCGLFDAVMTKRSLAPVMHN